MVSIACRSSLLTPGALEAPEWPEVGGMGSNGGWMDGSSRVEVELGNRYAKDNSDDALFAWLCMCMHIYIYMYI